MKSSLLATLVLAMTLAAAPAWAFWELYDDFSSGTLDTNLWNQSMAGGGTAVVSGGVCTIEAPAGAPEGEYVLSTVGSDGPYGITGVRPIWTPVTCTGNASAFMAVPYLSLPQAWAHVYAWGMAAKQQTLAQMKISDNANGTTKVFDTTFSEVPSVGSNWQVSIWSDSRTAHIELNGFHRMDYDPHLESTEPYMSGTSLLGAFKDNSSDGVYVDIDEVYVLYGYNYAIPYIFSDSSYWTGLAFSNALSDETMQMRLRYYANDGTLLSTENVQLDAKGHNSFAVQNQANGTAWVHVRADRPLQGLALMGGTNGTAMFDMDMTDELGRNLVSAHVDTTSGQWVSTLMLVNPHPGTSASVLVSYISEEGSGVHTTTLSIPAMGATQTDIGTISGSIDKGSLLIRSDVEIAGFLLYDGTGAGNNWKSGLSVIPVN